MDQRTNKNIAPGSGDKLGVVLTPEGANFAIFSQYASEVYLLLFDSLTGQASDIIKIEHKTEHTWHVFVHEIKAGQLYGYMVNGDYNPGQGHRFNLFKLLIDPYAKAIAFPPRDQEFLLYAYNINAPEQDLMMDQRDNQTVAPKSIIVEDGFDWQNDTKPNIPKENLIIYEVHLKGFTAHPSSKVQKPGTYLGFIEKIPYLKELGINAVELLPIHQFYVQDDVLKNGLTNYWGYDTVGFFAPHDAYSTGEYLGSQVQEFKTMVRHLHAAGIEVILDVVFNHSAEGNRLGPTLSLKGIDNPTYYCLMQNTPEEPYRYYKNDTGCGNTINAENPAVIRLILDSLRYWVEVMHVDGFRFDLGTILGRKEGQFSPEAFFFKAIAEDPVLKNVKMIGEPWDLTTYQVGNFPHGWAEWNGKFRDTMRKFLKGDEGQAPDFAKRFCASRDIYEPQGRDLHESINFITCHDGFTLKDLFSYNEKHNENNKEENRDGTNDNYSWNCGAEGETDQQNIIQLRKQMVKNALSVLFLSWGTPMMLYGDEVMRTQHGNNNVWCQDNELSWMDWNLLETNAEILEFTKKAILFRKQHAYLGKYPPESTWSSRKLQTPSWDKPKLRVLCFFLNLEDEKVFLIFNANHRGAMINIPPLEGIKWHRLIDTSKFKGFDFCMPGRERPLRHEDQHYCSPRSVIVLVGKKI